MINCSKRSRAARGRASKYFRRAGKGDRNAPPHNTSVNSNSNLKEMIVNKMISGRAAGGRMIAGFVTVVLAFASLDVPAATQVGDTVVRSRTLRYEADSLTNPVAAQKLYSRIRITAKTVCHQESDDVSNGRALAACVLRATDVAVANVNSAELTALHRARVAGEDHFAVSAWLTSPTPCAQCG